MEVVKGYKVFNPDWTAQHGNFKYEVGKEYEMGGEIIPCKRSFHFCENLIDCFDYYTFTPEIKVAEVEGTGQIKREGNKVCCSHIRIVKEISIYEVLRLLNNGVENIGIHNQGNGNQGNCNQGDYNRGDYNHGSDNIGIGNKGNHIVGLWCTREQPFYLFNKLCIMSLEEFKQSENHCLLLRLAQAENSQEEWKSFTPEEKQITLSTDNFDPEVFKELFDIDVTEEE